MEISNGASKDTVSIVLPPLEDANAIQLALMQIMRLIVARQIDNKQAGLLLYALQTASANLKHLSFEPEWRKVVVNPSATRFTPLDISVGAAEGDPEGLDAEHVRLCQQAVAEMKPELAAQVQKPDPSHSATVVLESTALQSRHALPFSPRDWERLKNTDLTAYMLSTLALNGDEEFYAKLAQGMVGQDMTGMPTGKPPE